MSKSRWTKKREKRKQKKQLRKLQAGTVMKKEVNSVLNLELLYKFLEAKDGEMFPMLMTLLEDRYSFWHKPNSYLVCVPKGAMHSVCLVAHIDTVKPNDKVELVHHTPSNSLYNKCGILGADDRAGVYGLVHLALTTYDHDQLPMLIFPDEEEVGGIGARALVADKILDEYIDKINVFIELDRYGIDQYVYYSHSIPRELKNWIELFGYHEEYGSFSDVKILTDAYQVAHVNLSVGYYDQHTRSERLDLDGLTHCMKRMTTLLGYTEVPRCIVEKYDYSSRWDGWKAGGYTGKYRGSYSGSNGYTSSITTREECAYCGDALIGQEVYLCHSCKSSFMRDAGMEIEDYDAKVVNIRQRLAEGEEEFLEGEIEVDLVEPELIACALCDNIEFEEANGMCANCVEKLCSGEVAL